MSEVKRQFKNPIQIGILVKDARKVSENLMDTLGIGPFRIVDFPPPDAPGLIREYHGKAGNFSAKFYFVDLGNIELELIEPVSGENIWSDYIERHGTCIHHIKFLVDDLQATETHLAEHELQCSQKGSSVGKNAGKVWAFYDSHDRFGFDLEIMTKTPVQ